MLMNCLLSLHEFLVLDYTNVPFVSNFCAQLTPRSFLRNISKPKKVKLQVENVCWNVIWLHPYNKSSRFSGGWVHFLKENTVKEGDICDFELISTSTEVAVIKVTIRRM